MVLTGGASRALWGLSSTPRPPGQAQHSVTTADTPSPGPVPPGVVVPIGSPCPAGFSQGIFPNLPVRSRLPVCCRETQPWRDSKGDTPRGASFQKKQKGLWDSG